MRTRREDNKIRSAPGQSSPIPSCYACVVIRCPRKANTMRWCHGMKYLAVLLSVLFVTRQSGAASAQTEPVPWQSAWEALPEWSTARQQPETDWLIDARPFPAHVYRGTAANELVLANGLIARTFRLAPNAATVGLDHLVTGAAMLRGVKPEAVVEIDGQRFEVGGLTGQPNYAFLRARVAGRLRADPAAFQFVGFEVGRPDRAVRLETGATSCARFDVAAGRRHHCDWISWGRPMRRPRVGCSREAACAVQRFAVSVHYETVRRSSLLLQMDHGHQRHGSADSCRPVLERSAGGRRTYVGSGRTDSSGACRRTCMSKRTWLLAA